MRGSALLLYILLCKPRSRHFQQHFSLSLSVFCVDRFVLCVDFYYAYLLNRFWLIRNKVTRKKRSFVRQHVPSNLNSGGAGVSMESVIFLTDKIRIAKKWLLRAMRLKYALEANKKKIIKLIRQFHLEEEMSLKFRSFEAINA